MATYKYIRFGQAYGEGTYGSCTYNCAEGEGTGAGTTSNNALPNTGIAVAGIVTLACLIALIAVLVRIWRKPAKPIAQEEAVAEDEEVSVSGSPRDPA